MDGILFRHKATYGELEGDLIVSNSTLSFIPSDCRINPSQIAWSNIKTTKYSPADDPKKRIMLRVEMITNIPPMIFNLIGPDVIRCRNELERLKSIVSEIRQHAAQLAKQPDSLIQTQTQSSVATTSSARYEEVRSASEYQSEITARQNLLQADKSLASQYHELVEVDKILTEEEFWSTHSNIFPHKLSANASTIQRGKGTSMIGDVSDAIRSGKRSVNLTMQQKEHIFQLYPAIRNAFEAEVGTEKSEKEFWIAFFQSEFYSRNFNSSVSLTGHQIRGQTDDIFSRYEHNYSINESNGATKSIEGDSKQSQSTQPVKMRKLTGAVNPYVDLTMSEGDFHTRENVYYGDATADASQKASSGAVHKYNRHSAVIMSDNTIHSSHNRRDTMHDNDDVADVQNLDDPQEKQLIPLHLRDHVISTATSSSYIANRHASSSSKAQSHDGKGAMDTAATIKKSLVSVIPSTDKAFAFLVADINQHEANHASDKSKNRAVGDHFVQEMQDTYKAISDLLRFAYAIMLRDGAEAPHAGSPGALKMAKLLQRLDQFENGLILKRKYFEQQQQPTGVSNQGSIAIITEMMQLLSRAKTRWRQQEAKLSSLGE